MSISRAITGISKPDTAFSNLSQPAPTLTVAPDGPVASENALKFLKNINATDRKYTIFNDKLVTFTNGDSELGFYRAKVQSDCYKGERVLSVEAKSYGKIDGVVCCTELQAYINENMETVYQELFETINLEQGALERTTIIEQNLEGFSVTKTIKNPTGAAQQPELKQRTFSMEQMHGYISEAANIIIQRVMMTKGVPDYFDVLSFDSDTNLCTCTYKDLPANKICVGSTSLKCYGIERKIHSVTDVPVTWHTYFMPDGHLISRAQVGSPILMKVATIPKMIEHDEYLPIPEVPFKPLDWTEDAQLTSMFLDKKEELISNYKQYCRNHPELQFLLADFLQSLLIHKPNNTINFASAFFATFSNRFAIDPPLVSLKNENLMLSEQ